MTNINRGEDVTMLMRHDRDRFVAFAFASADILLEVDEKGKVLFADGATGSLIGIRPDQLIGQMLLDRIALEDRKHVAQIVSQMRLLQRIDRLKIRLTGKDGQPLAFAVSGYKLPYMKNHIFLTLSLIRAEMDVEEIGRRDLHSGLLKEKAFAEAAVQWLKTEAPGQLLQMTMLDFQDIEHWLQTANHQQAEGLLDDLCAYLRQHAINPDAAGNFDTGMYGLVHRQELSPQQILKDIADIAARHPTDDGAPNFRLKTLTMDSPTLSHQDSARALQYTINRFAQNTGEDFSLHSLSEGYKQMLDETVRKITAFKKTVNDNGFEVAFQPIQDLHDNSLHHYEALVRFRENAEFSNPFQFITFGEEAGIIADFDMAMCQRTIEILDKAYAMSRKPIVSVNLSGNSISSDLFKDSLIRILEMHENVRKQIIFEITESAKIHNLDSANLFIKKLRSGGNLTCLDDFGVGESSFDYLRKLEVDFVKIDGSYIKDCLSSPRGQHLCKAIIGLCNDLDMVTIGEMIEDKPVADFLAACGVEFGQGYYLGRPTTDIEPLIRSFPMREMPCVSLPKRRAMKRNGVARRWSEHILEV